MGTFAISEDPDEMLQSSALQKGLNCLLIKFHTNCQKKDQSQLTQD